MEDKPPLAQLAADILASYVENNALPRAELPELIGRVYDAFALASQGGGAVAAEETPPKPAVSIRKSVSEDHIVYLEEGLKFRSIKRHLGTAHSMTPEQYRARWSLPRDYPMVAPGYAKRRSELAKQPGLGQKASARKKSKG